VLSKLRSRLSYANVVASIALFIALGGTSYGLATGSIGSPEIKNNSVRSKDIRNNDVRSQDIRNQSLLAKDFKAGQLPAGPQGPQGERGPQGAQGEIGATGPAGPFPDVLPSGKTLRGAYDVQAMAAGAGSIAEAGYPFIFTLASKPAVHYISSAGTPPAQCPGTNDQPEAQPGHLCVYENARANTPSVLIADPETNGGNAASEEGFYLQIVSSAGGFFASDGTWAVTSP